MEKKVNFYALLQLSPDSDPEVIKEALNEKIRDLQGVINSRDPQVRKQAEKEMELLLEARKVLLDPVRSKEYKISLEKAGFLRPTQVTILSPQAEKSSLNTITSTSPQDSTAILESLKIAVTPPCYDNIGEIITSMGYNFTQIYDLSCYEVLCQYDLLFLNCGWPVAENSTEALQRFVAQGGILYASDRQAPRISAAFPTYIEFDYRPIHKKSINAYVIDSDLAKILGEKVKIIFDIADYFPREWSKDVRIYLKAPLWSKNVNKQTPIVVSFRCGQGEVFYTSFHNHAQPAEQERKLLKFLVLKPIAAKANIPVVELAQKKGLLEEACGG
jgi:curved DNA-binding protein CbpA